MSARGTIDQGGPPAPTRDSAARNWSVVRIVAAHATAVVAEWASVIAVLVLVFDRHGAETTGLASVGMLVAALATAPFGGRLVARVGPHRARVAGLVAQGAGCAAGAAAGWLDLPLGVLLAGPLVAQGAATLLRPSGAVLLPAQARTSRELVVANLWIWYVEGASVLLGPLLATALLAVGGPGAALAGCAVSCLVGACLSVVDVEPVERTDVTDHLPSGGLAAAWAAVRGRPGLTGVLAVVWAQYLMIGALDFVLVVIARDDLDLGDAGPGWLSSAFGCGAVIAVFAGTKVVSRRRLAVPLGASLLVAGVAFLLFGTSLTLGVALVALPILGVTRSLLDGASRLLLQRSVEPRALGAVFVVREMFAGLGMVGGAVFALVTLRAGDAAAVLLALGAVFVLTVAVAAPGLRAADTGADVPVVEMSLLQRLPMFAPLPVPALEAVARAAVTVPVAKGDRVVTQGDTGDRFYVVVDGSFEVCMSGAHVRHARRNDFFGEVALLADVPRTATVTATTAGTLLAIERGDFLVAVTGAESSRTAAWAVVDALELEPHMLPAERLGPVEP